MLNIEQDCGQLSDFEMAKAHALIDSAAVAANIVQVVSIESAGADVMLVGRLTSSAIEQGREPRPGRLEVRVRLMNAFYGIHSPGESVGFLIVQPPITILTGSLPDDEIVQVVLRLPIREALRLNIPVSHRGRVCCRQCNGFIPQERLRAVKNAHFCVKCQQTKEANYR
jgi:hypothetical protein